MHPPSTAASATCANHRDHSGLPGCRVPGPSGKLWEETSPALPLWPQWTSESEAHVSKVLDGCQTQALPSHLLGQGQRQAQARAKAQMLPELRWLQWMTLHPASPGHRLEGQVLLPSTQLSPAGPGVPGALGSLAPPGMQLARGSHKGTRCCSCLSMEREHAARHPLPSLAGWNRSQFQGWWGAASAGPAHQPSGDWQLVPPFCSVTEALIP